MSIVVEYTVPGDAHMYEQVRAAIGAEHPAGMLVHLVVRCDGGLRHTEVWDTDEHFDRFRTTRVTPAVHGVLRSVGFTEMPPGPRVDRLDLIDIQLAPS